MATIKPPRSLVFIVASCFLLLCALNPSAAQDGGEPLLPVLVEGSPVLEPGNDINDKRTSPTPIPQTTPLHPASSSAAGSSSVTPQTLTPPSSTWQPSTASSPKSLSSVTEKTTPKPTNTPRPNSSKSLEGFITQNPDTAVDGSSSPKVPTTITSAMASSSIDTTSSPALEEATTTNVEEITEGDTTPKTTISSSSVATPTPQSTMEPIQTSPTTPNISSTEAIKSTTREVTASSSTTPKPTSTTTFKNLMILPKSSTTSKPGVTTQRTTTVKSSENNSTTKHANSTAVAVICVNVTRTCQNQSTTIVFPNGTSIVNETKKICGEGLSSTLKTSTSSSTTTSTEKTAVMTVQSNKQSSTGVKEESGKSSPTTTATLLTTIGNRNNVRVEVVYSSIYQVVTCEFIATTTLAGLDANSTGSTDAVTLSSNSNTPQTPTIPWWGILLICICGLILIGVTIGVAVRLANRSSMEGRVGSLGLRPTSSYYSSLRPNNINGSLQMQSRPTSNYNLLNGNGNGHANGNNNGHTNNLYYENGGAESNHNNGLNGWTTPNANLTPGRGGYTDQLPPIRRPAGRDL